MFTTVVLIFLVLRLIYKWIKLERPPNFPPGPRNYPFVGAGLFLKNLNCPTGSETLEKLGSIFGPVTGLYLGNIRAIVINGYEASKELWNNDEFASRIELFQIKYVFGGQVRGIFSTNGELWKEQRRFSLRSLRDFGFGKSTLEGIIHEEIEEAMSRLKVEIEKTPNSVVSLNGRFTISTTNIIWGIISGKRYSHDDKHLQRLIDSLRDVLRTGEVTINFVNNYPITRFIPWLNKDFNTMVGGAKNVLESIKESVENHQRTRDPNDPRDFIDTYLAKMDEIGVGTDSSYSCEQLGAICFDLFGAGSESTASQIDFALLYMLLYPDIQEKVHQEIESVLGSHSCPSMADFARLPYCEAVLTEVLRIRPIAPVSVPHLNERDTQFMGYDIPKDTMSSINIRSIHMDKSFWGDPDNFRPERFLDKTNGKFVKPERVLAFGAGKRVCMGESLARMMLYLIFVSFMQKFKLENVPGEPKPTQDVVDGFTVTPKPFKGKLTFRQS